LVVGQDGNLYFACDDEGMIPAVFQIGRLSPDGKETLLNPSLREIGEDLDGIKGLASGSDGSLYVAYAKAILKISMDGGFTTLVNPVVVNDCDLNVPSNDSPWLRGLAVDSHGIVYAAASGCGCVIKITPDGHVTTVLKAEKPWAPSGVAIQNNQLYVLEHLNPNSETHKNWPPRVRKLGRNGIVRTLVTITR
jgi:sugar lactone lactonase YvrE